MEEQKEELSPSSLLHVPFEDIVDSRMEPVSEMVSVLIRYFCFWSF